MLSDPAPTAAFTALLRFLEQAPLTATIGVLERTLEGSTRAGIPTLLERNGVTAELLAAAIVLREHVGRLNDIIHACAISLALPNLLDADEVLRRPSLAAGNDPSRPYDIETDRRIAEFKLARWDGHDATRKRQLVKDLVHLAADQSGRSPELYVLGDRPRHFLQTTRASVAWALDRSPSTRALYKTRFGNLDVPIPTFVEGAARVVNVIDLYDRLPDLIELPSTG